MSNLPGAKLSGVRDCNCRSDHLSFKLMEEGGASAQAYPVKTNSAAIENKLYQIPFHSRVLKHVVEPVQLNSMQ